MNKNEKMKQAINGQKQQNIPFSFWTHLPDIDRQPKKPAEASFQLYKDYDLDFIKTMNNGMYAVEDYGTEIDFSQVAKGGVAQVVDTPIKENQDWTKLAKLEVATATALQRELTHLKHLLQFVDGQAPVIMTVFSPLTTADKLAQGRLVELLEQDDATQLHQALEHIAETTAELAKQAIELGAAGVYFASQMSSYEKLTAKQYETYGVPYDLQVLEGAANGWFNAIHIHGNDIMFDLVKHNPVQVFNWHIWETLPEIKEGLDYTNKCVMGGIARMDITHNRLNELRSQIYRSILSTQGRGLILTPGCGIRHPFAESTIRFIKQVKTETENLLSN